MSDINRFPSFRNKGIGDKPPLTHSIHRATGSQVQVSVCGEVAHQKDFVPFLIGIRRLSVDPQFLPALQRTICAMSVIRTEDYARQMLSASICTQVEQVRKDWAWVTIVDTGVYKLGAK